MSHIPGNGNGDLITQGEALFFTETFGGNGRTCGTCHREFNDLTIDVDFIADLLFDDPMSDDPLFVGDPVSSAFNPDHPPFDPNLPTFPAFEFPDIMKSRGLILENINGFEEVGGNLLEPPVFRAAPSLFNLEFTAPYGYSACCDDLRTFAMGAVVQHFPKTLARMEGPDFVLPTDLELDALEAFMLSNLSPADGNFKVKGKNSLLSTDDDPRASDSSRRVVRGRDLFRSVGCITCHRGKGTAVFDGDNLNTGVEALELTHPLPTPTVDTGVNLSGQFQTPQLFGLRKQHFFHTGAVGNNTVELPGETLRFTNLLDAVNFYRRPEFTNSPTGGAVGAFDDAGAKDMAAFLEGLVTCKGVVVE